MKSIFVFLDVTKGPDFRLKISDVSRTQGVYMFFRSSLDKV